MSQLKRPHNKTTITVRNLENMTYKEKSGRNRTVQPGEKRRARWMVESTQNLKDCCKGEDSNLFPPSVVDRVRSSEFKEQGDSG